MNWSLPLSLLLLCCSLGTKNVLAGVPANRNDLNPATHAPAPAPKREASAKANSLKPFYLSKKSAIPYSFKGDPVYSSGQSVKSMAFTQDGRYLNTGVYVMSSLLWRRHPNTRGGVTSDDGYFLFKGQYTTFDVSQPGTPYKVSESGFRHGYNYDSHYTPNGRFLFSIDQNGQIRIDNVEDMENPQHISTLTWPDGQTSCLTVSQDGKFMVAGGGDNVLRVYDISNPLNPLEQSKTEVGNMLSNAALSPDGKWVAFVGNGFRLKVYDLSDHTAPKLMSTQKFPEDDDNIWTVDLAISPDSKWLAVAGSTRHHALLFYNMESPENPKLMSDVEEVKGAVSFVDISRDGKLLATGILGRNSGVTIFDVVNPEQPQQVDFIKSYKSAYAGAFSPVKNELIVDLGREELELYEYRHYPDRLIRPNSTKVGNKMTGTHCSVDDTLTSTQFAHAFWPSITFAAGIAVGYTLHYFPKRKSLPLSK